jgi:hypothetical protein
MTKWFLLLLSAALLLPCVLFANAPVTQQAAAPVVTEPPASGYNDGWMDVFPVPMESRSRGSLDAFDSTVILDDFESTYPAWTSVDLTDVGTFWHVDDTLAVGPTAWYCGDTTLAPGYGGAYNNHWLQFLMTDTLDLSGATAPTLTFKAQWKMETPSGATAPYNAWDGWNVWGSTDAGATWTILTPTSPAYMRSSSYAWGSIWSYGANIPVYCDTIYKDTRLEHIFSLASLVGSSQAMVRWGFASDDAFSGIDDPTYFGLVVDSIRILDGETTILSNDGSADEFQQVQGPLAGNTWHLDGSTYHSPDTCWSASVDTSLLCAIRSFPFLLPTGYTLLTIRYWVWCDMPDYDGDNNNALDDLYDIWVEGVDTSATTRIVYDYAYDDRAPAPGGNSLTGWVYRTRGLTTGGTQQLSIDITAWAGHTVQLLFRLNTDNNDDGGVGSGLHVDDVQVVATRAFLHDLSAIELRCPFPTTVGTARSFTYKVKNEGLTSEGNSIRSQWWTFRPNGTQQSSASPTITMTLDPGHDTTFTVTTWTPDVTGCYLLRARSNLVGDLDHTNDTTWSPTNVPLNSDSNLAINVRPAGVYELGYHLREIQSAFLNPRYIRYTVNTDVPTLGNYDITTVKVMWQYDSDLPDSGALTWVEFWTDGVDPDHPGTLINRVATRIDTSETIGAAGHVHWWTLNLAGVPGLANRTGNFWLSVTPKDSVGGGPLPLPMGRSVTPVAYDGHHYVIRLDTVGTPLNPSPGRYLVQTTVVPTTTSTPAEVNNLTALRDGNTLDILLNWTASARANGYYVYRLTTPTQSYQTGTLLTPLPLTVTNYRDVGVLGTGLKFFYTVIAVN